MEAKTILLTGFMPFGSNETNPSWEAVDALPETVGANRIEKLLLPVEYGRAAALAYAKAVELHADAVLCVGLAAGRSHITPEAIGVNVRDASIPDNAGFYPHGEPVFPDGPAAYFSTLPVRRITEAIRSAGVPAALSYTAGTYVCNDLLYALLHRFSGTPTRVAFIHVPPVAENGWKLSDTVRALTAAIGALDD